MEIIQHRTPGKWASLNGKVMGGTPHKVIFTTPADKLSRERTANVKLASAAPDLLEALEAVVDYLNVKEAEDSINRGKRRNHQRGGPSLMASLSKKAQDAINKAKGVDDSCEDPNHVNKSEVMEIVNDAINNLR